MDLKALHISSYDPYTESANESKGKKISFTCYHRRMTVELFHTP